MPLDMREYVLEIPCAHVITSMTVWATLIVDKLKHTHLLGLMVGFKLNTKCIYFVSGLIGIVGLNLYLCDV